MAQSDDLKRETGELRETARRLIEQAQKLAEWSKELEKDVLERSPNKRTREDSKAKQIQVVDQLSNPLLCHLYLSPRR
jgi:hypothetical protein